MNDTLNTKPRRRLKLWHVIAAVVAVAVAGIAAVYLLFFTGDSPDKFKLDAVAPTTIAAGAQPTSSVAASPTTAAPAASSGSLAGTWAIASDSSAGYRVREKLAQLPAQSDAVGRTSAITGSITVAHGSEITVANGATFEVDVTKLKSDESMRDNRIRTMGLESSRYPKATFVSTSPIQLPASAATGQAVKAEVTGDLTIHGVTKRVTIPLDAQLNNGRIEVVGALSFPFSDFGMTAPSIGGFVTVTDTATLEFKLYFDKK